jgi:CHAD domain-containing protein
VRGRLTDTIEQLPAELLLGPVAADLTSVLASDCGDAGRAVEAAMSGRRYQSLLLAIDSWRTSPPRTKLDPKTSAVSQYVDKAEKKARKRLSTALASGVDDDYHRARKAMKRYRYASELAEPQLGKAGAKAAGWAERLQDELGALQDTVTSSAVLLEIGRCLGTQPRRNGFSYGLMYGREQKAADEIRRQLAKDYG